MGNLFCGNSTSPSSSSPEEDDASRFLIAAAREGDISSVKEWLNQGVNVNANGKHGLTALHQVCFRGNKDLGVATLLLQRGADVHATNDEGKTPLHQACYWGCIEIANLLIEHGADLNAKDKTGATPLNRASCTKSRLEVVRMLIDHGADRRAKDDYGRTALYRACWYGSLGVVQLIAEGVDVNETTKRGDTPLQVACKRNHSDIVWFLVRQHPWIVSETLEEPAPGRIDVRSAYAIQ